MCEVPLSQVQAAAAHFTAAVERDPDVESNYIPKPCTTGVLLS